MAVTAVGSEIAKRCGFTRCKPLPGANHGTRPQGEREELMLLKCLGDRLKRYTIFYRGPRETTSIYCNSSKILARRAALLSRTISIFRSYHCLTN
jgi:hypothetical protein